MSFAAESWAWDQRCGGGIAKSILAYLAFRADRQTGEAFPSMDTIIRAVEFGERAVRKAMAKLVKAGKVKREQRFASNGRCTSALYRLPVVAAREPEPAAPEAAPEPAPTPANQQGSHPGQSAGVILEPVQEDSNQGRKERAAPASPPPPAPSPSPVSILPPPKEASRIEVVPAEPPEPPRERATRWHDGVTCDPDVLRTIAESGQDPTEITGEIAVWAEAQPEPPIRPWVAFAKRWIALKPRFDGRRDSRGRPRSAAEAIAERYFGRAAA